MSKKNRIQEAFNYLKYKGLTTSQKDLSEKMGANRVSVSRALNGDESYLTDDFIERLNTTFNSIFSSSWLLTGEGSMLRDDNNNLPRIVAADEEAYQQALELGENLIPEYNATFHAGQGALDEPEYISAQWLIPQAPKESYIITMMGNSMQPKLASGAKLLVKPFLYTSPTDIPFGSIFAIAVANSLGDISTHIKILRRHPDKESTHWIARSINREEYDDFDIPIQNVRSLAIVLMEINQHFLF